MMWLIVDGEVFMESENNLFIFFEICILFLTNVEIEI